MLHVSCEFNLWRSLNLWSDLNLFLLELNQVKYNGKSDADRRR